MMTKLRNLIAHWIYVEPANFVLAENSTNNGAQVFLLVYVVDILLMGSDSTLLFDLLKRLATTFKIRDLGTSSFFLGIETVPLDGGFILSQRKYMVDILKRAGMEVCKPLVTPVTAACSGESSDDPFDNPTQYRRLAGALQYLTVTRLDLSYAVNCLYQHMHSPTVAHPHWVLLKMVLQYVKGTT
ncbi:PREDICTED: uncharacterized protein LOC109192028 [Ipomoea nil]|uniref:uncharacterized protein LOC109192028 n=1 Tax=Ipomoea nil TaxID=35883 RepID=UPI000901C6BB|nr:PREDICTED: uncharacterized protein LOC109192028 [Ipomoea nil]XP_019198199.1 PREDICTED: uncharacterized protein LOC109192028 [Ipomoea nil]